MGKGTIGFEAVLPFLDKRKGLLDAVVFSGGECTLHKSIYDHIVRVKSMVFLVKVDTNGSKPELLQRLIDEKALDYVALDYKALPSKFEYITQSNLYASFEQSLEILLANSVPFEVRTTYHSELLDEEDIKKMIRFLEMHHYVGNYYIQHFRNDTETLGNLSYSKKNILDKNLTTSTINVVFR